MNQTVREMFTKDFINRFNGNIMHDLVEQGYVMGENETFAIPFSRFTLLEIT